MPLKVEEPLFTVTGSLVVALGISCLDPGLPKANKYKWEMFQLETTIPGVATSHNVQNWVGLLSTRALKLSGRPEGQQLDHFVSHPNPRSGPAHPGLKLTPRTQDVHLWRKETRWPLPEVSRPPMWPEYFSLGFEGVSSPANFKTTSPCNALLLPRSRVPFLPSMKRRSPSPPTKHVFSIRHPLLLLPSPRFCTWVPAVLHRCLSMDQTASSTGSFPAAG